MKLMDYFTINGTLEYANEPRHEATGRIQRAAAYGASANDNFRFFKYRPSHEARLYYRYRLLSKSTAPLCRAS